MVGQKQANKPMNKCEKIPSAKSFLTPVPQPPISPPIPLSPSGNHCFSFLMSLSRVFLYTSKYEYTLRPSPAFLNYHNHFLKFNLILFFINLFILFIFGCIGSSLLRAGFL